MSVSNYLLSGFKFKKAKELSTAARLENNEKSDALFQQAYDNFASISNARVQYPEALHCWGLALINQARQKTDDAAFKLFEAAIMKFNLCDTVKENHLGASLDKGVALMEQAKVKKLSLDDDLYSRAKESFLKAEQIQQGSASYNLACLYALQNNKEACFESLKQAKNHGVFPDKQAILEDTDLDSVKQLAEFDAFINSLVYQIRPPLKKRKSKKVAKNTEKAEKE